MRARERVGANGVTQRKSTAGAAPFGAQHSRPRDAIAAVSTVPRACRQQPASARRSKCASAPNAGMPTLHAGFSRCTA